MIDSILIGRIAMLPFAPLEWAVLIWFMRFGHPHPRHSIKRVASWLSLLVILIATPFIQIYLYRFITSAGRIVDGFVPGVIIVEELICLGLLVWLVSRANRPKP